MLSLFINKLAIVIDLRIATPRMFSTFALSENGSFIYYEEVLQCMQIVTYVKEATYFEIAVTLPQFL